MSLLKTLTSPDPQALSLAAFILLVTNLTVRSLTQPNPTPTTRKAPDRISSVFGPFFLSFRRAFVCAIGAYHAICTLTYPSPPTAICPRAENLSPHLFTWNTHTIMCVAMILVAAPIRLMCFRQLGPNFTFQLATPGNLVTSGLYSWVQHPSYTTNLIVVLANGMLFERKGGVVACWLPKWIVDSDKVGSYLTMGSWIMVGIACYGMSVRIMDEEAMLKRAFGEEWEVYHRKTKRFIPYVF